MAYIYLFDTYCFTYEHFESLILKNGNRTSALQEWLQPLVDDNILITWLSSLESDKAKCMLELIDGCRAKSKSTESIVKMICFEVDMAR